MQGTTPKPPKDGKRSMKIWGRDSILSGRSALFPHWQVTILFIKAIPTKAVWIFFLNQQVLEIEVLLRCKIMGARGCGWLRINLEFFNTEYNTVYTRNPKNSHRLNLVPARWQWESWGKSWRARCRWGCWWSGRNRWGIFWRWNWRRAVGIFTWTTWSLTLYDVNFGNSHCKMRHNGCTFQSTHHI